MKQLGLPAEIYLSIWEEENRDGLLSTNISVNDVHGTWWVGSEEEFARLFLACLGPITPESWSGLPEVLRSLQSIAKRSSAKPTSDRNGRKKPGAYLRPALSQRV